MLAFPLGRAIVVLAACMLLGVTAHASAQVPFEPNNSPKDAAGGMTGGSSYKAGIESDSDQDYLWFRVNGSITPDHHSPVTFSIANTAAKPASLSFSIETSNGAETLAEGGSVAPGAHGDLTVALPEGMYLLHLTGQAGAEYTITVSDPEGAVTDSLPDRRDHSRPLCFAQDIEWYGECLVVFGPVTTHAASKTVTARVLCLKSTRGVCKGFIHLAKGLSGPTFRFKPGERRTITFFADFRAHGKARYRLDARQWRRWRRYSRVDASQIIDNGRGYSQTGILASVPVRHN